jgi:hypothetical protein
MSYLVFDGDELRLTLYEASGTSVRSWPASNFGGPRSDFYTDKKEAFITWIPDGEYPFEKASQSVPHRHAKSTDDEFDGKYGTLGILRLAPIVYGGQFHDGLGVHAGRRDKSDTRVISAKPLVQGHYKGPYYRTNGCIRTNEAAMHAIAAAIAKDPLRILKVQNNGQSPSGKVKGSPAERLIP